MVMDLSINEKDEERESEAQSDVRAKKRGDGCTYLARVVVGFTKN